jgi:hypothetical protein
MRCDGLRQIRSTSSSSQGKALFLREPLLLVLSVQFYDLVVERDHGLVDHPVCEVMSSPQNPVALADSFWPVGRRPAAVICCNCHAMFVNGREQRADFSGSDLPYQGSSLLA